MKQKNDWVKIEDNCELPNFDEDVILYFEIVATKKTDPVHKYKIVGSLSEIITGKNYRRLEWKDKEYNCIVPTHWTYLPDDPQNK